ncbi:DUF1652 domain-containing protein [Pseudomonas abietaniphila]|uniref:DUF1652 domain-containing protein n=1 Tax=Pseudomonas abietaniphila TaxID=89065 RepID=A0A1G8HYB5_9PSED|nr:Protein of unknown function [Pseudomonas abietaniphila]
MISDLEIKHLLEVAFLPNRCVCNIPPYGSISLQIYDQKSGELLLTLIGIARTEIASSRSIAKLVGEIRHEIRLRATVGLDGSIKKNG